MASRTKGVGATSLVSGRADVLSKGLKDKTTRYQHARIIKTRKGQTLARDVAVEMQSISAQPQKQFRRKQHQNCAKAKRTGTDSDVISSSAVNLSVVTFVGWNKRVVNLVWHVDLSHSNPNKSDES